MIKAEWFYWLIGAFFVVVAAGVARDRTNRHRLTSAAFWGLLGLSFPYSSFVVAKHAPAWLLGIAVIVLAAIAGTGRLTSGDATGSGTTTQEERRSFAERFGNRLFIPVLVVPVVTALFAALGPHVKIAGRPVLEVGSETVIGLGVSAIVALVVGMVVLRTRSLAVPLAEGRRLTENIGWASVLPQLLSMLGLVFASAGVGTAIGRISTDVLPRGALLPAVLVYCVGMAVFTVIMGNAFAAFPVLTAAIGYPLLVKGFGGDAPAVFAIGMLSGYCGTLSTPMAANFNIVPVALLELKSDYAVIRAQLPTAVPLLVVNCALMYVLAF